jgi:hypothetical protein
MARVCPQCGVSVARGFLCPTCGIKTIETEPSSAAAVTPGSIERPTFAGGVFIGLLVAQALYYASRNLATAYLLGMRGAAEEAAFWHNVDGQILVQVLQAVTLFIGGMLAGAGHSQSVAAGAALGVANSVLLSMMLVLLKHNPTEMILYAQPVLHAVIGAAGGFVGHRVWQPAPALAPLRPSRKGEEALSVQLPEVDEFPDVEPLPWGRILLGSIIAVGGTMWARMFLNFVLTGSGANEIVQSQFITWELTMVVQLIGGGMAGSNTRNGVQYGFWVGMLSAGAIVLLISSADVPLPTNEALGMIFGLDLPHGSPAAVVFQAGQALLLGIVGGWLGSLILPRISRRRRLARGEA